MVMLWEWLGGFGQLAAVKETATDGCETRPVFLSKKVRVFILNSRQGSPVNRRI